MERIAYHWTRNPSLSPTGRNWILLSTAGVVIFVGVLFAAQGAWPILLFSLLEAMFTVIAFRRIAVRDGDYERLVVIDAEVMVETCYEGKVRRLHWNLPWVQVICRTNHHGDCELALRSCGQVVPLGRLISDEQRLVWSHELRRRFRVVTE